MTHDFAKFLRTVALAAAVLPLALAQAPVYKVLHRFPGSADYAVADNLAVDPAGNVYGVDAANISFIYEIRKNGHFSVLHTFATADGLGPWGVTRDSAGNLYGATAFGGPTACNCGTIYKLDPSGNFTVLHAFDGAAPGSNVILDSAGNLYGVLPAFLENGQNDYGEVYKLDISGNFTVLYTFHNGLDGYDPAYLNLDTAGNLYGLASGTINRGGVIFKIDSSGNFSVLYALAEGPGGFPQALVIDSVGNLYGVTPGGGSSACPGTGCGTIFKVDTLGNFSVLLALNGTNQGRHPNALAIDGMGNLYGATEAGGNEAGLVFKFDTAGNYTKLHKFALGFTPVPFPVFANGALYAATIRTPATNPVGLIFSIVP